MTAYDLCPQRKNYVTEDVDTVNHVRSKPKKQLRILNHNGNQKFNENARPRIHTRARARLKYV